MTENTYNLKIYNLTPDEINKIEEFVVSIRGCCSAKTEKYDIYKE